MRSKQFLRYAVTVSLHINKQFYQRNCVLCEVRTQQTKPGTIIADYETKVLFLQLSCNLAISSQRGKGRVALELNQAPRKEGAWRSGVTAPRTSTLALDGRVSLPRGLINP